MAFSHLFRRYSTSNDVPAASYAYMDQNSIAETLLDELESQCRNSVSLITIHKRNSHVLNSAPEEAFPPKRHSSVDYSWLTPNNNLLQSSHDVYQLPDMIKMELSELIRYVSPEDCTLLINQFRRHIRSQSKSHSPENIIAIFRKTLSDYIDEKPKQRASESHATGTSKSPTKSSTTLASLVRNNPVNTKKQADDEQHCIAELTEISISSSSNDGHDANHSRAHSHA